MSGTEWCKVKLGVRYRKHSTRKHGVRYDRYFALHYKWDGKTFDEGLGWSTEEWTEEKALELALELKNNRKTRKGPGTYKEWKELNEEKEKQAKEEKIKKKQDALTLSEYFTETYYPAAKAHRKESTYQKDMQHFKTWLKPDLGSLPIKDIKPFHIEKVKKRLIDDKKSPRTIEYVFATFRQIWNMARRDKIVFEASPTREVKRPRRDNRRQRYLTFKEAEDLLKKLQEKSTTIHDITLLSLHTGMRAGEIFSLTWGDIDLDRGIITIRDPKGVKNRAAYMTDALKEIFKSMDRKGNDDPVFNNKRSGGSKSEISHTFRKTVKELKFNEGVTDPRQRVCFHTCRHTFASWLVENGTDLYTVKELMGHSSLAMTERYSHLSEGTRKEAIKRLEKRLFRKKKKGNVINIKSGGKKE
ncbi:MAG TPA: tyrosine-type recombinase/integrase [Deltaproteobacteria bacterium]|nr:tyrosine-type recombinase/integrase [Deltaproteobacteria bacterium]